MYLTLKVNSRSDEYQYNDECGKDQTGDGRNTHVLGLLGIRRCWALLLVRLQMGVA
jgi:hypothetical protein